MLKSSKHLESIVNGSRAVVRRTSGLVGAIGVGALTLAADGGIGWIFYKNVIQNPSEDDRFPIYFFTYFGAAMVTLAGYLGIRRVLKYTGWYKPDYKTIDNQ